MTTPIPRSVVSNPPPEGSTLIWDSSSGRWGVTNQELGAAVAGSSAVSGTYASSANGFVPTAPAYYMIPANYQKWRKALGGVRAGVGSAKVLFVGDSTTYGTGSTSGNPTTAASGLLRAMLNAYMASAQVGLVCPPPTNFPGVNDVRWTVGAGWNRTSLAWAANACFSAPSGTVPNLSYTPGAAAGNVDTFDVYWLGNIGLGTFQANIDGGADTAIVTNVAQGWYKTTITAAAGSTHTLNLHATTGNNVYIAGVDAYLSTASQVRIGNVGQSGSTTTTWNDPTAVGSLNGIKAWAPDLTVINLGINDANAALVASTWQTNIAAIAQAAQVSGDVLLCSVIPSQATLTATFEQNYRAALPGLCASLGCGYVDLFARFGSYALASAAGIMSDGAHPNNYGYGDVAAASFAALSALG